MGNEPLRLLGLPFGGVDDHLPCRNRVRFNNGGTRVRPFSLNLTSLVEGASDWHSNARHSPKSHRGLCYRGLRSDNFVGADCLSRRRAAVLVVRVPDLELEFQSIVAEEIPAGMPHGLGWRQFILIPVFG